jgi:hypothetical protein
MNTNATWNEVYTSLFQLKANIILTTILEYMEFIPEALPHHGDIPFSCRIAQHIQIVLWDVSLFQTSENILSAQQR